MTAFTDFAENALVDWLFRGQAAPALPANFYFGLLTVNANEAGGGATEVVGGNYARVAVARSLANFSGTQGDGTIVASNGATGTTKNNIVITFPAPTANWGQVVAIAIFDAAVGGNMWIRQLLALPKNVNAGDAAPSFAANAFAFQIDD